MNPEIVKSQIRSLLIVLSGIGMGWFASQGYITQAETSAVLNSPVFLSLATAAAGFIWSALVHTQKNAVAIVNDMAKDSQSPVKAVILAPTSAGIALAAAVANGPGVKPTTVVAGTVAAASAAQ